MGAKEGQRRMKPKQKKTEEVALPPIAEVDAIACLRSASDVSLQTFNVLRAAVFEKARLREQIAALAERIRKRPKHSPTVSAWTQDELVTMLEALQELR